MIQPVAPRISTHGVPGSDRATAIRGPGSLIVPSALFLGIMVAIYGGKYLSRDERIDRYYPLC